MKNIQVVDSGNNCYYPVYAISDQKFLRVFPDLGQDIEFIEDVASRLGGKALPELFGDVWPQLLDKQVISGLHGTLFYQLLEKKPFCLNKKERKIVGWKVSEGTASSMKNIQMISAANECFYPIYAATNKEFSLIFPEAGQDVEFSEDAGERLGADALGVILENVRSRQVAKRSVVGLHGTLFEGLRAMKKEYYPTKRDRDISG